MQIIFIKLPVFHVEHIYINNLKYFPDIDRCINSTNSTQWQCRIDGIEFEVTMRPRHM